MSYFTDEGRMVHYISPSDTYAYLGNDLETLTGIIRRQALTHECPVDLQLVELQKLFDMESKSQSKVAAFDKLAELITISYADDQQKTAVLTSFMLSNIEAIAEGPDRLQYITGKMNQIDSMLSQEEFLSRCTEDPKYLTSQINNPDFYEKETQ